MSSPISGAGLILDIAGALTLASAFITKNVRQIRDEAGSYLELNPYLLLSLVKQSVDARVGAALLGLGFAAQLDGAVGWRPEWATWYLTAPIGAAGAVVGMTVDALWRRRAVRTEVGHLLIEEMAKFHRGESALGWTKTVESYLGLSDVVRGEDEQLDCWGRRALGRRCWDRVLREVGEE